MTSSRNYYELLGVSPSVDGITLRKTFHRLSKALHPDTSSLPVEEAARKFQQVFEAYELLSDPSRRKAYDDSLASMGKSYRPKIKEPVLVSKNHNKKNMTLEVRRPFSGGELFSLLLLLAAFLISSILAITFALSQGRAMQVRPSWLIVDSNPDRVRYQTLVKASSEFFLAVSP